MGIPHEMVSVYHDDKNKKTGMDLSSDSDIDVAYEMHIRSFTFEFEGPAVDHLCGRQKSAGGKSRFHSAVENTREPTVKGPINNLSVFRASTYRPGRRPAG